MYPFTDTAAILILLPGQPIVLTENFFFYCSERAALSNNTINPVLWDAQGTLSIWLLYRKKGPLLGTVAATSSIYLSWPVLDN